jgi:hypothetical protein
MFHLGVPHFDVVRKIELALKAAIGYAAVEIGFFLALFGFSAADTEHAFFDLDVEFALCKPDDRKRNRVTIFTGGLDIVRRKADTGLLATQGAIEQRSDAVETDAATVQGTSSAGSEFFCVIRIVEPFQQIGERKRPGNEVPLHLIATDPGCQVPVILIFDTLGLHYVERSDRVKVRQGVAWRRRSRKVVRNAG